MVEFFNGLDHRLRVSGMLADSIMMGIVNSAMEDAYKNSCSKEGDLVRLHEKSRFCELATMQLDWCLKFLQEETDDNGVIDGGCDPEKLLYDLLETRDRIHNRLEETELAIMEKDTEFSERMEIESDLRLALEVKDEDISSLHIELGLEREKSKRKKDVGNIRGHKLGELKSCVDQQLSRIQGKLEDGQQNLKALMRRISSRSLDLDKMISEFDLDGEEGPCSTKNVNSKLMLEGVESFNLEIELKEMTIDMDILREKIDSSFKMMASSASLFKTILDEQQWVSNVEKETINIILRGFLGELQYILNHEHGIHVKDTFPIMLDSNWDAFINGVTSLHNELEKLVAEKEIQPEHEGGKELRRSDHSSLRIMDRGNDNNNSWKDYDSGRGGVAGVVIERDETTSYMLAKEHGTEGLPFESPSGCSVADKIGNHESIIENRSQEIGSLKVDTSKENRTSTLKSERSLDYVKEIISRVTSRVEAIVKGKAKLVVQCDDPNGDILKENYFMKNYSHESTTAEKEPKLIRSIREFHEQPNNKTTYHFTGDEILEEMSQLKQDKEDLDTRFVILDETYAIIFSGLIRTLNLEYIDYNINSHVREDVCRVIFSEMVKEWRNDVENYDFERRVMEETYNKVIIEVVKDIFHNINLPTTKWYVEDLPINNTLSKFAHISKKDITMQEVKSRSNLLNVCKDLELDFNQELVEPSISHIVEYEHGESNNQDYIFSSASGSFKKALQKLMSSKIQLREAKSTIGISLDNGNVSYDQVTSTSCLTQDESSHRCLPSVIDELRSNLFSYIIMPLTEFSRAIMEFEITTSEKIRRNMKRLEDLNHCVAPLAMQVNSIKKEEMLYRKAFTRRCNDLQTAEVEVDLLGDEVDLLYALIEKIYKVLNCYSPVLQQYSEITDVQRLIWNQLNEEELSTVKQ